MLVENLINFCLVISIQFLFFIFHAYKIGELDDAFHFLKRGLLIGLPFGITIDLFVGHYLGFWDYIFGFAWWFLIINGLFSYGIMVANVFLLYHQALRHMYLWSIGIGVVYEVSNYFFPVWQWTFATPKIEYAVIILAGYTSLTLAMMLVMRIIYKTHFRLIPF